MTFMLAACKSCQQHFILGEKIETPLYQCSKENTHIQILNQVHFHSFHLKCFNEKCYNKINLKHNISTSKHYSQFKYKSTVFVTSTGMESGENKAF